MKHVVDDLTALLDGALDPAARRTVEAHLAACAGLPRRARPARAAPCGRWRGSRRRPSRRPGFAARLAARLADEPRRGLAGACWRPGAGGWRSRPAGLAAAALAGVLMVRHQHGLELGAAAELDLLQEYEVVASVGDVETAEDAALIAHLDTLEPGGAR